MTDDEQDPVLQKHRDKHARHGTKITIEVPPQVPYEEAERLFVRIADAAGDITAGDISIVGHRGDRLARVDIARVVDHFVDNWPRTADGFTVEQLLRLVGSEAMVVDAAKERMLQETHFEDRSREQQEIHYLSVMVLLATVGQMVALRVLREVDPDRALRVARVHWEMCVAGDATEVLCVLLMQLGVDPTALRQRVRGG